jgi:uncharacterized protein
MPPEWQSAIDQFNAGEYYACHDTIEALWMDAVDPDKKFYQGVLQIAVACHHLKQRNWRGAVTLLGEGIGRLPYYQPSYEGIDVTQLLRDSSQLLQTLQTIGTEGTNDFVDRLAIEVGLLPQLRQVSEIRSAPDESVNS